MSIFSRNQTKKSKPDKASRTPKELLPDQILERYINEPVSSRLEETLDLINSLLGENEDFVIRRFHVFGQFHAAMFYFSNLIDHSNVNMDVLKPMMYLPHHLEGKNIETHLLKDMILNDTLYHCEGKLEQNIVQIVEALLSGQTAIVIDELDEVFLINTLVAEKRAITQPQTEQVIRGPREGFIESLGTNLALIRYRLQTPNFRFKTLRIGRLTKSKVAICYIKGIVNPALVKEIEDRLASIDIDGILDAGYLEQLIEDNHLSPFPQIQNTERPDKAVANLLEGRAIILVNGSPFALIVPSVFTQFYQTTEDYNERFLMVSFIRLARLVALMFSLIFPALYVSVISFNPELIPTEFAVAVAGGRSGVPFPSVVEVLIMEVAMEVLREATIRLPQQVGGALSIVGVLVVGQAAVSAGFASPITVVVIALTTIGSFATPAYNAALALRMLRFPLIILGGMFGLYGVMVGMILVVNHLLSLKSFGVPYIGPIVPGSFEGMKDTVIRGPLWWMKKRPTMLHPLNESRFGDQTLEALKQPPSNSLDPIKVGDEREGLSDGVSSGNHSDPGSSNSD